MKIKTKRLIIRPITLADKNEIFEYRHDKETNRFQGWIPGTVKDVEVFIAKTAKQINEPETWFHMFIILILVVIWNLLYPDNKLFAFISLNNHARMC